MSIPYCTIKCQCGYEDELEKFSTEKNKYKCGSCGAAWEVVSCGDGKLYESGLYVPPHRKVKYNGA